MTYKKVNTDDFLYLKEIVGSDYIKMGKDIDPKYSHDQLGTAQHMPDIYIRIQDKHQVVKIMAYAYKASIPVTVRGAGTGLVGAAVPILGGILLDMSGMNKIIELDEVNLTLTVEPGVRLFEIYDAVESKGLFYAPDPGEKRASIGGNISTNAGGMRAIKYGTTRAWVRALEVVTPKGELLTLGGKVVKDSTGYGLKDLIIGSEGTLAIIVSATLKLIPKPKYTKSMLVAFDKRSDAIHASPKLIKDFILPTAVEFFEKQAVEYSETFFGTKVEGEGANAYLLLSYDSSNESSLDKDLEHVKKLMLTTYGAKSALIIDPQKHRSNIWNIRGGFLNAIKASSDFIDECDVVLPRSHIESFLNYVNEVSKKLNVRIPYFGHIGDGNLHIYLCKDNMDETSWQKVLKNAFDLLYEKAFSYGGRVSGEHGIGIAKKAYMHELLGKEQIELMRGIKSVFDPKHILNPKKVI